MKVIGTPLCVTAALFLAGMATPVWAVGHGGNDGHGDHATPVACDTAALISAIETANANGGGTLSLARNCDYQLTIAYNNTDNGLPAITKKITIKGNGATIERTGATDFRIFEVDGPDGTLSAQDLTISGGHLTGGLFGAGVYVQPGATLSLTNSTVSGNTNDNDGGGIGNFGHTALTSTTLTGNSAREGEASTASAKSTSTNAPG